MDAKRTLVLAALALKTIPLLPFKRKAVFLHFKREAVFSLFKGNTLFLFVADAVRIKMAA